MRVASRSTSRRRRAALSDGSPGATRRRCRSWARCSWPPRPRVQALAAPPANAPASNERRRFPMQKRDFSSSNRLLLLSAFAVVIGGLSTLGAWLLLAMIRFFTNLFFYQTLSLEETSPAGNTLGAWVILVPALGGLIVGLMARYGSDKIRGHGIPEALEAILFGKSQMSAKVAVLKPLSSGVVIGSGGPFGAEGPVIMTGGAAASLLAQAFHLTS